jgi:hypothetical protein
MVHCYRFKCARYLGSRVEPKQANFQENVVVYYLESFFTLVFCCQLNLYSMYQNHNDFREMFFTSYSDTIQSILVIIFTYVLLIFLLVHVYIHVRYQRNIESKKEAIKKNYLMLFDGIRLNQYGTYQ